MGVFDRFNKVAKEYARQRKEREKQDAEPDEIRRRTAKGLQIMVECGATEISPDIYHRAQRFLDRLRRLKPFMEKVIASKEKWHDWFYEASTHAIDLIERGVPRLAEEVKGKSTFDMSNLINAVQNTKDSLVTNGIREVCCELLAEWYHVSELLRRTT